MQNNNSNRSKTFIYTKPQKRKHKWTYYVALMIFAFWTLGSLLGFVSFVQNCSSDRVEVHADTGSNSYIYESNGFTIWGNLPGFHYNDSYQYSYGNISVSFKPSIIIGSTGNYFSFGYLPNSNTTFDNLLLPLTAQLPYYTSQNTYTDSRYGCKPTYTLGMETLIYTFTLGLNHNYGITDSVRWDISNSFDFIQNNFYYKRIPSFTQVYVARVKSADYTGNYTNYFNYDIVYNFSGMIQNSDFKYLSYYTAHTGSLADKYPNFDTTFFTNSSERYSLVGLFVDYYDQNDRLCVSTYYSFPTFYNGTYYPGSSNYVNFNLLQPFYNNYTFTNLIQVPEIYNYSQGYNDGWDEGVSQGYEEGYSTGKKDGESIGYNSGVEDSNNYSFLGLIGAVIDAPIKAFTGLLSFEVFGVEMSSFALGILSLCVVASIIKFIL